MKNYAAIIGVCLGVLIIGVLLVRSAHAPVTEAEPLQQTPEPAEPAAPVVAHELITVVAPEAGAVITSPLVITGEARGYWFFEASFPVVLVDWDGRIIAEHYATAEGEWMTEEFVPFTSEISFESPYTEGDPEFMSRGALILRKDNPSGLPENDDAFEIPIRFAP